MKYLRLLLLGILLLSAASCAQPPGTIPTVIVFDNDTPRYYEHLWLVVSDSGVLFLFRPDEPLYSVIGDKENNYSVVSKAQFHNKTFKGPVLLFSTSEPTVYESEEGWIVAYAESETEDSGLSSSTIYLRPVKPKKSAEAAL